MNEYDAENRLSKAVVTMPEPEPLPGDVAGTESGPTTGQVSEVAETDGTASGNRIKTITQENLYNGDGQRVRKSEGAKETHYFYQDGVVSYTMEGKKETKEVQNLLGLEGNVILAERAVEISGETASERAASGGTAENGAASEETKNRNFDYYLYNKDVQGSTTSVLNESGAGELSYEYDDFGETEVNGNSVFQNENCYTGGIYDGAMGLYYLNARYYDPENGRFLTEDTYRGELNEPDTLHLYAYCKNNPINYVDPSGHIPYAVYGGIEAIFGSVSLSGMLPIAAVCVGTFLLIAGYHRWGAKIKQEIQKKVSIAILRAVAVANSTVAYIKGLTISLARAKSIVRKRMTEKHHIVPRGSKRTKNAREALSNASIDINSKKNTIRLDYRLHKTLHRKTYYDGIEKIIGSVKTHKNAVKGRLTATKTTLKVANAYISKF